MAIKRGRHWKDEPAPDGKRKRTIKNWMHYKEPGWSWVETDTSDMNADTSTPNNWTGNFEFTHQARKGPLQVFFGDSTDPANTALVGMRSAEHPNHWVNFKALGVNQVAPILQKAQRRVVWPNLWTNSHLAYEYAGHKLNKLIQLTAPGHPASFRFAMRIPAQASYEVRDNRIVLSGPGGAERLVTKPVYGWDANDEPITATLVDAGTITRRGKEFPTYRIIPSAVDLLDATYPVTIDPTVEISGSTDIDDTYLNKDSPNNNHGGQTIVFAGVETDSSIFRAISRFTVTSVPEGSTIDSASWTVNQRQAATKSYTMYQIKDANAWVEGTTVAGSEAGATCWNDLIYQNQAEWAGSPGCSTSGTDYFATPAGTFTLAGSGTTVITIPAAWVQDWVDGNVVNNGFIVFDDEDDGVGPGTSNGNFNINSTQSANESLRPSFSITYSEPAGAGESFTNYEGRGPHRLPRADYQQEPKERKK